MKHQESLEDMIKNIDEVTINLDMILSNNLLDLLKIKTDLDRKIFFL